MINSKLRVLMVTARYFPSMGGIETHVHEIGCRLVKLGVNVTVLSTVSSPQDVSLPKEEVMEGMRVLRVRAWPPQRDYYIAPEIGSMIEGGNWDLVHCQGCHTFVPPLAMLAAKRAGVPYVVTFHSGGHTSRLRTGIRGLQWRVLRPLFARAERLIGVSHFEADHFRRLLHLSEQQFAIIPNGAGLPSPIGGMGDMAPPCLIVSVGRLERYKGHQHLITALPIIRKQRPDAQLLIVGAGPYEVTLRELALRVGVAEYVEIRAVAASDRGAMAEILVQAKLVALLSEYESQGIAIMEALALGRPTLVADTSAMRELAVQGLARAVALHSTPAEMAAAVLQQIEEPLTPIQQTLPTWQECAQKLLALYTTVIGRQVCVS